MLFLEEQLEREGRRRRGEGGERMSHGDFEGGQWDFRRLSELKTLFVDNGKEIME